MIIRNVVSDDAEAWLSMRMDLWPETDREQHRKEMGMMCSDTDRYVVFVGEDAQGVLVGFAEASLRSWAEGCLSSPVAYLEGWYVAPHARRQGTGRALLSACEQWARSRGATEMASDTDIGNEVSENAHRRLGFQVVGKVVAFRKDL